MFNCLCWFLRRQANPDAPNKWVFYHILLNILNPTVFASCPAWHRSLNFASVPGNGMSLNNCSSDCIVADDLPDFFLQPFWANWIKWMEKWIQLARLNELGMHLNIIHSHGSNENFPKQGSSSSGQALTFPWALILASSQLDFCLLVHLWSSSSPCWESMMASLSSDSNLTQGRIFWFS